MWKNIGCDFLVHSWSANALFSRFLNIVLIHSMLMKTLGLNSTNLSLYNIINFTIVSGFDLQSSGVEIINYTVYTWNTWYTTSYYRFLTCKKGGLMKFILEQKLIVENLAVNKNHISQLFFTIFRVATNIKLKFCVVV